MNRRRRDPAAAGAQMQEHQEIHIDEPAEGPHPLGREVTLPQRLGMAPEELIPRSLSAFGSRIESMFFQDVFDRLSRDLDPQPPQLAEDAGVAPRVLLSQLHHQGSESSEVRGRPGFLVETFLVES